MSLKKYIKNKRGWKKGSIIGLMICLPILSFAIVLCIAEYIGLVKEGYVGAGWTMILLGFPTTLIEIFIEDFEISFSGQIISLIALVLIQYVIGGGLIGFYLERKKRINPKPS
jgi:hypothetical protein